VILLAKLELLRSMAALRDARDSSERKAGMRLCGRPPPDAVRARSVSICAHSVRLPTMIAAHSEISGSRTGGTMTAAQRIAAIAFALFASVAAHADDAAKAPETSFDGLQRVESKRFALAWVREGADLSGYTKLLVLPAEISYKSKPTRQRRADDNFELNDSQMKRLRKSLRDAFKEQLVDKGGWQVVEEPGPDVLLVRGGLIDMIAHVPPTTAGRSNVYLDSFGEATLVIELYDSQSHQILARIADRDAAEPPGNRMGWDMEAPAEVRRMFNAWAKRFREALDAAKARQL
jgi:hypothetical protein